MAKLEEAREGKHTLSGEVLGSDMHSRLKKSRHMYIRLLLMNLTSRCVSCHQLLPFPLDALMARLLRQIRKIVTALIAFTAQATHKLVPPR